MFLKTVSQKSTRLDPMLTSADVWKYCQLRSFGTPWWLDTMLKYIWTGTSPEGLSFFFSFFFWKKNKTKKTPFFFQTVLLHSSVCPWTQGNPPASTSWGTRITCVCPAEAFLLTLRQCWARGLPAWWPGHLMGACKGGHLFYSSQTPEVKKLQVWVQNLPLATFLILNEVWEALLKRLSQAKTTCYFGVFSNIFLTVMWAMMPGWLVGSRPVGFMVKTCLKKLKKQ